MLVPLNHAQNFDSINYSFEIAQRLL